MRLNHIVASLAVVVCFPFGSAVNAANVTLDVVLTIDTSAVAEIPVGDKYIISFTFDDSAVDGNVSIGSGAFPDALQSFSISRDPGNSGTWDPAGGTPDLAADNFVINAFGDNLTLQVRGTGFPSASPGPFFDVSLGFSFSVDIVDTGSGQTLDQQLGSAFQNISFTIGKIRFDAGCSTCFDDASGTMVASIRPTVSGIPAVSEWGIAIMALLLLIGGKVYFSKRRRATA